MVSREIERIKERNRRVEADKAWETSLTRRFLIALSTYVVIVIFLIAIEAPNPLLNAFVPSIGYIFSTLSLPFIKKYWMKHFFRRQ